MKSLKKKPTADNERRNSFDGTAQYVSPEMLKSKKAVYLSDVWALGCILFQMLTGHPPFQAPTEYLMFQKIVSLDYKFPPKIASKTDVCSLIERLLVIDVKNRLGAADMDMDMDEKEEQLQLQLQQLQQSPTAKKQYSSIRAHAFLKPIDGRWDTLHMETPPHMPPYVPQVAPNIGMGAAAGPSPSSPTASAVPFSPSRSGCGADFNTDLSSLDGLEPGLGDRQMARLLNALALSDVIFPAVGDPSPYFVSREEFRQRLALQAAENPFHRFVNGNLILKQGVLDKKRHLHHFSIARRRTFLLTTPDEHGPHLIYVDGDSMQLKGSVPFSAQMRTEPKNFKSFHIVTVSTLPTHHVYRIVSRTLAFCHLNNSFIAIVVSCNTLRNLM